jgi:hypothetical protein
MINRALLVVAQFPALIRHVVEIPLDYSSSYLVPVIKGVPPLERLS